MRRWSIRYLIPLAAITLVGAACSDDDDDGPVGSPQATEGTSADSVATGGTPGETDHGHHDGRNRGRYDDTCHRGRGADR